ncbi:MAG TPA: hypothetical protein VLL73_03685, partial [Desulfurivibrionaceae bacterium]|nr:hypothetical protein [Desulfurivibrionaceae bacterium]
PIILCTGYSEVVDEEKATAMGVAALFYKPVSCQRLMMQLRQLFEAQNRGENVSARTVDPVKL